MSQKVVESPVTVVSGCGGGPVPVSIDAGSITVQVDEAGPALWLAGGGTSTPGTPQTFISAVVPVGKEWRLRQVDVRSRAHATFSATVDSVEFDSGRTGPADANVSDELAIWVKASAGQTVALVYDQPLVPPVPVEARILYTEHTAT